MSEGIPQNDSQGELPSRRNILERIFAAGAVGVIPSFILTAAEAVEKSPDEEWKRHMEEVVLPAFEKITFQGRPEDAPGIGSERDVQAFLSMCLLPQNPEEFEQYEAFFEHIHGLGGVSFRSHATFFIPSRDLEFDEKVWEFLAGTDGEDGYIKKGMEVAGIIAPNQPDQWLTETQSLSLDRTKKGAASLPLGIIFQHESGHGRQIENEPQLREGAAKKCTNLEIMCLTDVMLMALIHAQMQGEVPNSYNKDFSFPSGEKWTLSQFLELAKGIYGKDGQIEKTFLKVLMENAHLVREWVYGKKDENKEVVDFIATEDVSFKDREGLSEFQENQKAFLNKYIEQAISAGFDGNKLRAVLDGNDLEKIDSLHKMLVLELEIKNDPIYEFHESTRTDRKNSFLIKRTAIGRYFKAVQASNPDAKDFWEKKRFVLEEPHMFPGMDFRPENFK